MKRMQEGGALIGHGVAAVALAALVVACGGGGSGGGGAQAATAADCVAGSESVSIVAGNQQTATLVGTALPERPRARFVCESVANRGTTMPLAGAVEWRVTAGGGLVNGTSATVQALAGDGTASVEWTLGGSVGMAQTLIVSYLGNPAAPFTASATFSATALATTTSARVCADPGGTDHGETTVIAADTSWLAAGSPHRGGTVVVGSGALLSIEAGAVICVAAIEPSPAGAARFSAVGTAQAPIRVFGTALRLASHLSYVQAENAPTVGSVDSPASVIDNSTFRWTVARDPAACMQVVLAGDPAGGAIRRSVIAGYGSADCAALRLVPFAAWDYSEVTTVEARIVDSIGDGVSVAQGAVGQFRNCEVSSSGRHGILVPSPGNPSDVHAAIGVAGCNLFGNGGHAIANQATVGIDATGNWWGDPGGPFAENGDGVNGTVNVSGHRAAPVTLGY